MTLTTAGLVSGINTTSDELITVLDDDVQKHYLLNAWRFTGRINGSLSNAEHPNILTAETYGRTRYVSYETYYAGPATPLVLALKPQLQSQFEQQGLDLKAYVESL